jgi:glutamyl/glutaminyl-tRNA synthetase
MSEAVAVLIVAKGEEIRTLKASGAAKEAMMPHVKELLALKEQFKVANGGVAYDPPKEDASKKAKGPAQTAAPAEREGPSKKELNKMARKEGHKRNDDAPAIPDASPAAAVAATGAASGPAIATADLKVVCAKGFDAKFARAIVALLGPDSVMASLEFAAAAKDAEPHEPYLLCPAGSVSGDANIGRFIARAAAPELYFAHSAFLSTQVDQWVSVLGSGADAMTFATILNTHLADKTFLVSSSLSIADIAVYIFLLTNRNSINLQGKDAETHANASRWHALMSVAMAAPKKGAAKSVPAVAGKEGIKSAKGKAAVAAMVDELEGDSCPPLEGAVMGEVVTRFPPEPSGYLHIGHVKAVLLNQYYANRYKGKLIIRFDDTNPSKEKDEYEENIIVDLATLNVKGDRVTHTSDYFELCEKYARQMIADGLAYMDDTPQEQMQAERMERVESSKRGTSVEDNLALFEALLAGTADKTQYCLRAKIDMGSVNGTMRDPVMYRHNATPHHRTGTKYKAYPTYDFACPIVDSVEGVTHALRTTEYNDRDEQFKWIIGALRLRPVNIWTYGKINFVHTVLSKRKLNWFVEQKLVDGWFDPRFPTVQGCMRRGVNVEALTTFILSQGASRRVITMEWDKFWSDNKKKLEEIAPRYMSVGVDAAVPLTVTNVPDGEMSAVVQVLLLLLNLLFTIVLPCLLPVWGGAGVYVLYLLAHNYISRTVLHPYIGLLTIEL